MSSLSEGLHRGFAVAVLSRMWALLVIFEQPLIDVPLQLLRRSIDFFCETQCRKTSFGAVLDNAFMCYEGWDEEEQHKQGRLIEHFVSGSTAGCAARLIDVNKTRAFYYFHRLQELIALHVAQEAHEAFGGESEVDESYFGGVRQGKRGRGAAAKVPVFGLLKRGGRV